MKPESVRRAVVHSREQRLARMERTLCEHLRYLRRHDPEAHAAFVACLRRVVARQTGEEPASLGSWTERTLT